MDIFTDSYENLSDNELVLLCNSDDSDGAVSALLDRYRSMVLSRVAAFRDKGVLYEIDDLFQEGMIAVYSAIKSYDYKSASFKTFARLCTDRAIITTLRKSLSKKSIPPYMIVELDKADTNIFGSPEYIVLEKEKQLDFHTKLETVLSSMEYSVLKAYLTGLSYEEIAQRLQLTSKAVDNALTRIKQKLK